MSCNFHVKQALLKAAAKKKFANFLAAKAQFKLYLVVLRCHICGNGEFYCTHSACCEDTYFEFDYDYCPDCGTRLA